MNLHAPALVEFRFDLDPGQDLPRLLPDWQLLGRGAKGGLSLLRNQIVIRCERTDDGNSQAISQSRVHGSAEQNLRLLANVTAKLLHQDFDFRQRHAGPARHLNQHARCLLQHAATVHQRIF